jgi:hypothetical protein
MIGVVLMLYISYQLSFKKAYNSYSEYCDLKNQFDSIQSAPAEIKNVEKQLADIELAVGMSPDTSSNFQKLLLEKVSKYCQNNNLVLKEFPKTIFCSNSDFEIETNQIVVEGTFLNILNLLYELEKGFRMGKLVSVRFNTLKDYKTGINNLLANLYFQNFKKKSHE